jgi:hypothetical protein
MAVVHVYNVDNCAYPSNGVTNVVVSIVSYYQAVQARSHDIIGSLVFIGCLLIDRSSDS